MDVDDLDIILFKGENYWFSYIVEWFTWSKYSHVGIILKDPIYIDPSLKGTYLFESGSENINDSEDGKKKFGVQITEWNSIKSNYTGEIWKRSITPTDDINIIHRRIKAAHDIVHNKPYDTNINDLIRLEIQQQWGNCQCKDRFVCSALVTFVLVMLNMFSKTTNWDLIEPKHFGKGGWVEKNIKNCEIGDIVKIK